ncbi:MAG: hypothetical protein CMJ17_14275 [Phenylobacterium sp.]|nr:hypothetical protein [Phenylobacterium sp.]
MYSLVYIVKLCFKQFFAHAFSKLFSSFNKTFTEQTFFSKFIYFIFNFNTSTSSHRLFNTKALCNSFAFSSKFYCGFTKLASFSIFVILF